MDGLSGAGGCRSIARWLLLLCLPPLSAAQLQPGERLDYTFSFQGILSGYVEIDIARARFEVAAAAEQFEDRSAYRVSLDLSTEPYAKAELIYPIRFSYHSWMQRQRQLPLLVRETVRTDQRSEEVLWFDRQARRGYRYVKQAEAPSQPAQPPAFLRAKLAMDEAAWGLLEQVNVKPLWMKEIRDYLSLLYHLRYMELTPGATFDLPLFNGKHIRTYRTEVSRERLQWGGWDLPAFKLELFEMRKGGRKQESVSCIWISDDERRLPIRFHVQRSFGRFEGVLETGRPAVIGPQVPAARGRD